MTHSIRRYLSALSQPCRHKPRVVSTLLALVLTSISPSCSEKIKLDPIGTQVARPISITSDAAGNFFYILNSDLKHRFEDGSILIVDRQGERKAAYSVDRLGRNIFLNGTDLLVTFDRGVGKKATSTVELYQVSTAAGEMPSLSKKRRWEVDNCNPVNGIIKGTTIAVACQSGKLLLGDLADDRANSTLDEVRSYPSFVRRALYIDAANELLYAFVTDWAEPDLRDQVYSDTQAWDDAKGELNTTASNDVPDDFEKTKATRQKLAAVGSAYQFAIIDLRAEKAAQVDGHYIKRSFSSVAKKEMRWIYYNLQHSNGDMDVKDLGADKKYYRTNFWAAHGDPNDAKVFYLSQRGPEDGDMPKFTNNIVKVAISGSREQILDLSRPTSSVFTFTRVFGHKDTPQTEGSRYLADFAVTSVASKPTVMVSSFRSLANFKSEDFRLMAAPLDPALAKDATTQEKTDDADLSYFAFALAPKSADAPVQLVAPSFYGDSINFFDIGDDLKFTHTKQIP